MKPLRIVIADDEAVIRMDLKEILQEAGHEVVGETANGRRAVAIVRDTRPDLVILDVKMPDMDGIEAAQKIRELDTEWAKDLIIIACTANAVKGAEEMFLQNGMNDYICKPIKLAELQAVLDQWLPAG